MLEVLDKYRDNELCEIRHDHISFLRQQDKKTPASTANFIIKNDVLMMYAKEYNNIPPKERAHWLVLANDISGSNDNSSSIQRLTQASFTFTARADN